MAAIITKSQENGGGYMKKVLVFLVLILLFLSSLAIFTNPADSVDSVRKEQAQITKFSDGRESALLTFNTGGGSNSALNISMPKRAKVLSASMDIEGRSTPVMSVYNFSDTKNNKAWYGAVKTLPTNENPKTLENKEFNSKEYNAVLFNDTTMADHLINISPYNISRLYHMFKFNVTNPSPTNFDFYWSGKSYLMNAIGIATDEVHAYIYCPGNSTWVKFFFYSKFAGGGWSSITINRQIAQAANYVNSTTNAVNIILVGTVIDITIMSSGSIGTDCVSLTVYTASTDFPSGVSLDVGADGNVEWTKTGTLSSRVTIDDGEGFKSSLQALIDSAGTDESDFTIIFKISTLTAGRVLVDKLNITIEALGHNEPPTVISAGFGHYYLNEDSNESGIALIDCVDYFLDDNDAPADLIYKIAAVDPPGLLSAEIDDDGHTVNFSPARDFFGTIMFRISATDSGRDEVFDTFDDRTTLSNFFNVTVLPINDAPSIAPLAKPLSVNESMVLRFNVSATDIDDTDFVWTSNLSEKISLTPDPENSSTAQISFTHGEFDVGKTIYFQISVTDSGGGQGTGSKLSASRNFTVDILNQNDAPAIVELVLVESGHSEPAVSGHPIKFKNGYGAWEDEYYNITVVAHDPDSGIDPDEQLTYSLIPETTVNGTLIIDASTGSVSLLPVNEDVGTVVFKVVVSDRLGESAEQEVEVQVKNRNDAPENIKILEPTKLEFYENETVTFKGECDDDDLDIPDSEEYLTFIWTTNHTSQPLGMGEELTNKKLESGVHEITLRVVDAEGEYITASLELRVLPVPDDKNNDDKDGDNKTNGDDDKNKTGGDDKSGDDKSSGLLIAGMSVIIVVIVVVVVVFGILMKKRRERKADEQAAALQAQQAAQMQMQPGLMPFPPVPGFPQYQQYPAQPGLQPGMLPGMQPIPMVPQLPQQTQYQPEYQPQQETTAAAGTNAYYGYSQPEIPPAELQQQDGYLQNEPAVQEEARPVEISPEQQNSVEPAPAQANADNVDQDDGGTDNKEE